MVETLGTRLMATARRFLPLLALALAQGCGSAGSRVERDPEAPLEIVATIGMIGDAAERVGGSHVRVTALMGPGIDPHLYKATEGDVRRLAGADLILFNGLHLEAKMGEVLEEMRARTATVALAERIDASKLLTPPEFQGAHDPHVWFDVTLWSTVVEGIRDALVARDPAHASAYTTNAAAYIAELRALDTHVRERAAAVPEAQRVLITAHDAFNYFGKAYGFEVRGLQGISTEAQAGTADVRDLAAFITERRIPAIFVESSVPPRAIEAVQAAVRSRGFDVAIGGELFSDAMGTPGTPEGTYVGMVRHNVDTITSALGRPANHVAEPVTTAKETG
jgi:manganese/zinc/iron transport system substrate-binding protein